MREGGKPLLRLGVAAALLLAAFTPAWAQSDAAACGVPALGLFGPTDPLRTGPWGMRSKTLRHRLSQTDHRRHAMVERGLAEITVDEVLNAALELLPQSDRK